MIGQFIVGQTTIEPWVATIGNFDGCHLGHQQLLLRLILEAQRLKAKAAVFSFDPHPRHIIQPNQNLPLIYDKDYKFRLLQALGLDVIYCINFTKALAGLSAEDFLEQHLLPVHKISKLITGDDFAFGKDKQGSNVILSEICKKHNIEIESLNIKNWQQQKISSSAIRKLLFKGCFYEASLMLSRVWSIGGLVEKGKQLGASIGFATANIGLQHMLPINYGVYGGYVLLQNKLFPVAINYGLRPTVSSKAKAVMEAHILNFNGNLYGQELRIFFLHKIRSEKKFSSLKALKFAILQDIDCINTNWQSWLKKFNVSIKNSSI